MHNTCKSQLFSISFNRMQTHRMLNLLQKLYTVSLSIFFGFSLCDSWFWWSFYSLFFSFCCFVLLLFIFFFAKLIKSFIFVGLFTRKTKSSNCNIKICVLLQQQQWSISRSRHEKLAALAPIVFLLGSSPPILPKTVFFLSEHYQTVLANVRVSCVCACILLRIFMISKSAV